MCTFFAHAESFNKRDWINIEEPTGTSYTDYIIIVGRRIRMSEGQKTEEVLPRKNVFGQIARTKE